MMSIADSRFSDLAAERVSRQGPYRFSIKENLNDELAFWPVLINNEPFKYPIVRACERGPQPGLSLLLIAKATRHPGRHSFLQEDSSTQ